MMSENHENSGFDKIIEMLKIAHTDAAVFPPTDLYNEGWMLRILLSIQSEGTKCFPFDFLPGVRWFSEALLGSPFLPRFRGDPLAEGYTHSDGVVGHFEFHPDTKTGLTLTTYATQFVVLEAKMFSHLSKGITNAKYYDQAARSVACIAWTISQSSRVVEDFESLGFYVIAPHEQIAGDVFSSQMDKSRIRDKVERRVNGYSNEGEKFDELQVWFNDSFVPVLERFDIRCISWESVIDKVDDASIREFYNRCLRFNARKEV